MPDAKYDEIAQWYDESVRQGILGLYDLVLPAVYELMGEVKGIDVCDLACGQGEVARQLARRGAKVVGVDLSAKLLEIARREEQAEPLGIEYIEDDAQALMSIKDSMFDLVLCNLALMDIPDVAATFRSVWRILRSGGVFIFSLTHPCILPPGSRLLYDADGVQGRFVRGYFQEIFWRSDNIHGVRGKVGAYHRTLSTYLNTLVEAGLTLERLAEPQATGEMADRLACYKEVPGILIVKSRK